MSFLNDQINSENDVALREELQERVDIIVHKIKFIDKVPVFCMTADHEIYDSLNHLIEIAGGILVAEAENAKVLIYAEHQQNIAHLIGKVGNKINTDWAAVKYNKVYLIDTSLKMNSTPADWVEQLENIAEMIHPGFFVFGNEGTSWVNFTFS
jgi:Mg-chelatase subunit ChlI